MANSDVADLESYSAAIFYITLISSIVASICSILVIVLIRVLKRTMRYSGHLLLINSMSAFQLVYDITFFFAIVDLELTVTTVANVFQRICGCGSSLYSNYIAFITLYSVRKRVFVNVNNFYYIQLIFSLIPGIADAALYLFPQLREESNLLYGSFRLFSILINFIMCGWILNIIRSIRSDKHNTTPEDNALSMLAMRMLCYPLIQAISRSVIAFVEMKYGFNFDYQNCGATSRCDLVVAAVVLNPSASYGYLMIFLIMQPRAFQQLKRWLLQLSEFINLNCCCGEATFEWRDSIKSKGIFQPVESVTPSEMFSVPPELLGQTRSVGDGAFRSSIGVGVGGTNGGFTTIGGNGAGPGVKVGGLSTSPTSGHIDDVFRMASFDDSNSRMFHSSGDELSEYGDDDYLIDICTGALLRESSSKDSKEMFH